MPLAQIVATEADGAPASQVVGHDSVVAAAGRRVHGRGRKGRRERRPGGVLRRPRRRRRGGAVARRSTPPNRACGCSARARPPPKRSPPQIGAAAASTYPDLAGARAARCTRRRRSACSPSTAAASAATPGAYALYGYETMSLVLGAIRAAGAHGNDRQVVDRAAARHARPRLGARALLGRSPTAKRRSRATASYRVRGGRPVFYRSFEVAAELSGATGQRSAAAPSERRLKRSTSPPSDWPPPEIVDTARSVGHARAMRRVFAQPDAFQQAHERRAPRRPGSAAGLRRARSPPCVRDSALASVLAGSAPSVTEGSPRREDELRLARRGGAVRDVEAQRHARCTRTPTAASVPGDRRRLHAVAGAAELRRELADRCARLRRVLRFDHDRALQFEQPGAAREHAARAHPAREVAPAPARCSPRARCSGASSPSSRPAMLIVPDDGSAPARPPTALARPARAPTSRPRAAPTSPRPSASHESPGSSSNACEPCAAEASRPPGVLVDGARDRVGVDRQRGRRGHERDVRRARAAQQRERAARLLRARFGGRRGVRVEVGDGARRSLRERASSTPGACDERAARRARCRSPRAPRSRCR